MEIKVLWYESQGDPSDVADSPLLQNEGHELQLSHFRSASELRPAIEDGGFGCAVVVHHPADPDWRKVVDLVGTKLSSIPLVLFLGEDTSELRRDALMAGAWHAVPRKHADLCVRALKRSLLHAAASQECAEVHKALKSAEAVLQKNQRSMALGLLLGSIAHEINNPLEGIGNLLYLAKRAKTDPETVQTCLDMSEAELNRVGEITKQVLSFHREASTPQEVSLVDLLDGSLTLFTAKLRERQITIHRQYDSAGWMFAYPGELRQALVNLISNALDAMEVGGRLTLRVRERGGDSPHLCATIADSGKGMPRQQLDKLGELFLTTKGEGGTGIGLWVTRRIVDKHHGGLRAYSSQTPGRSGTAFLLCFPPPHARLTGNTRRRSDPSISRMKNPGDGEGKVADKRRFA